jgi:hypothetical protein
VKLGKRLVSVIIKSVIKDTTSFIMAGLIKRLAVLQQLTAALQVSVGGPAPTGCREVLTVVPSAIYFTLTKNQLPKALFFPPNALGFHAVPPLQPIKFEMPSCNLGRLKAKNIPGIKYFNIANTL